MKFSACIVEPSDIVQCTLTCVNTDAQASIPRLKVAVLPGCDSRGNGIQISVESSTRQSIYRDKFYSNRTAQPPFLAPGAFVVTVEQVSPVHVGFQVSINRIIEQ